MLENLVFETQLSICQSISHTHTHTHTDIYMKRHIYMKNIYLRYKGVWYTTEMHIYSSDILYILTYIFKISFRFSYIYMWKLLSYVWLFCNPMDYTVHGILQARILEWVAFPFSSESFQPRDQAQVSCIAGGFFTSWATRKATHIPLIYLTYYYLNLKIFEIKYQVFLDILQK